MKSGSITSTASYTIFVIGLVLGIISTAAYIAYKATLIKNILHRKLAYAGAALAVGIAAIIGIVFFIWTSFIYASYKSLPAKTCDELITYVSSLKLPEPAPEQPDPAGTSPDPATPPPAEGTSPDPATPPATEGTSPDSATPPATEGTSPDSATPPATEGTSPDSATPPPAEGTSPDPATEERLSSESITEILAEIQSLLQDHERHLRERFIEIDKKKVNNIKKDSECALYAKAIEDKQKNSGSFFQMMQDNVPFYIRNGHYILLMDSMFNELHFFIYAIHTVINMQITCSHNKDTLLNIKKNIIKIILNRAKVIINNELLTIDMSTTDTPERLKLEARLFLKNACHLMGLDFSSEQEKEELYTMVIAELCKMFKEPSSSRGELSELLFKKSRIIPIPDSESTVKVAHEALVSTFKKDLGFPLTDKTEHVLQIPNDETEWLERLHKTKFIKSLNKKDRKKLAQCLTSASNSLLVSLNERARAKLNHTIQVAHKCNIHPTDPNIKNYMLQGIKSNETYIPFALAKRSAGATTPIQIALETQDFISLFRLVLTFYDLHIHMTTYKEIFVRNWNKRAVYTTESKRAELHKIFDEVVKSILLDMSKTACASFRNLEIAKLFGFSSDTALKPTEQQEISLKFLNMSAKNMNFNSQPKLVELSKIETEFLQQFYCLMTGATMKHDEANLNAKNDTPYSLIKLYEVPPQDKEVVSALFNYQETQQEITQL